ncbi:hypothetical protein LJB85_02355 [Porphyromonadaceae bacterium OttesenSCG-928-L07]|nr:hypothetical protein [Porphyromonadaceae bacterium OttesenSCG-928-L07]
MTIIICNNQQQDYFFQHLKERDIVFCASESDLFNVVNYETEVIIIIAELDWAEKKLSDFYGIEIAVQLRLKYGILSPIFICSFFDKNYFIKQDKIKYNILKVRGTGFLQLPVMPPDIEKVIENIQLLSKATLCYISNLLIDSRYLVDKITHDIRIEKNEEAITQSLELIDDYFSTSPMYPKLGEISKKIINAYEQKDGDKFYASKKELLYHLNIYSQEVQQKDTNSGTRLKHKILLLDDNINDINWATKYLSTYFDITAVSHADDAIKLIDKDVNNDFSVFIADWQLLYPNTTEQQNMLGFEVLEYASKKRFYSLFSLTSTNEISIREVNLELPFEHNLLYKDFQQGDSLWKSYINTIQQKIDKNIEVIANQPIGEAWTNDFKLDYKKNERGEKLTYKKYFPSFKEQYIEKRNSINWYQFKYEIDTEVTRLWNYYQKIYSIDERCEVYSINKQFGIELNRDIRNFLLIRRLYFAFWFNKSKLFTVRVAGVPIDNAEIAVIYLILRMSPLDDYDDIDFSYDDYKKTLNASRVFANQLSIETKRLPLGLLPEEKVWLKEIGISIEKGNDNWDDDWD